MPVFMLPCKPGTCQLCATAHAPTEPHNAQSLPYQMLFQVTHGRGATWADAVAHCVPGLRKAWRDALTKKQAWTEPKDGKPLIIPMDSAQVGKPIPLPNMEPTVVQMGRKKRKVKSK